MGSSTIFYAIGDFMHKVAFLPFEHEMIKWSMNYGILALGFVGLYYWLSRQKKFNDQAINDPNRLK
jgi:hypothetical protein